MPYKRHGKRIFVPSRMVSGGLDYKFETDPYDVELYGWLSSEQYKEAIENVNATMRKSRASTIDGILLATGPLLLPLAVWGIRHRVQTKKRKRLLHEAIRDFNERYYQEGLVMRWNRRPESTLTIERNEEEGPPTFAASAPVAVAITGTTTNNNNNNNNGGEEDEEEISMARATLISGDSGSLSTTNDESYSHHSSQFLQQQQRQQQQQQNPIDQPVNTLRLLSVSNNVLV